MARTPTVNRLQLGSVLRRLRIAAGLAQKDLGRKVFPRAGTAGGQTKLAAIERGDRSLHESELAALHAVLGFTDPEGIAVMRCMLHNSSQRGRWGGCRAAYPQRLRKYIDLEEDADHIRDIAVGLMPDLLMCENYIRTIFGGGTEHFEATVKANLARTTLLDDETHRFHFILDESAVRKAPKGNRAVVREQIAHVNALSRRSNIDVQVVPFIQSPQDAVDPLYPCTYLHIPAEGIAHSFEFVHLGARDDRRLLDDPEAVQSYNRRFADATKGGLSDDDARLFLTEISREYR